MSALLSPLKPHDLPLRIRAIISIMCQYPVEVSGRRGDTERSWPRQHLVQRSARHDGVWGHRRMELLDTSRAGLQTRVELALAQR